MQDILMMAAGLVILFVAGEGLLRGSVSIATQAGLSKLLVSAVIIGFGTSMPEMTVSVGAALKNAPEIALGNVVGSNIANILLIVGLAAVLYPLAIPAAAVRRDVLAMMGAAVTLCLLAVFNLMNAATGALMLGTLACYLTYCYRADKRASRNATATDTAEETGDKPLKPAIAILMCVAGLAGLVGGAQLLVTGAVSIARDFGISEAVIGLTIVAVGTSLPELATAAVASMRRHNEVVIGNILGSNVFNILCILGVTTMVKPIAAEGRIVTTDIWIMLAVSAFLSIFLWRGTRMGKPAGIAMLTAYVAYTAWLYMTASA